MQITCTCPDCGKTFTVDVEIQTSVVDVQPVDSTPQEEMVFIDKGPLAPLYVPKSVADSIMREAQND